MKRIDCADCGADTADEFYMVRDRVWAKAGMKPSGGFLDIGCLERRIGRRLRPTDFTSAPANSPSFGHLGQRVPKSARLLDRLGVAR